MQVPFLDLRQRHVPLVQELVDVIWLAPIYPELRAEPVESVVKTLKDCLPR